MARARNIKPGLFENEILGEADPMLTLLFIGLWTIADREGFLEDRPKRIKGVLFPYRDNPEIDRLLTDLVRYGFIHRIRADETPIIYISGFEEHQSPHKNERPGNLKKLLYETEACKLSELAPDKDGTSTRQIPLIVDSLIAESSLSLSLRKDDVEMVVNKYHSILPELPVVVMKRWRGSAREKKLQTRWHENPDHQKPEFWEWFFHTVRTNPHWMGQNNRDWKANLDWFLTRTNFDKVVERGVTNDVSE